MEKLNMKKEISIFIFSLLLTTFLAGCKPDQPVQPYNPLNGRTTAVFNPSKSYGTVTDVDGNVYKTIKIGDQVWMAENLRVTHYRNGDTIPSVKDTTSWANQTEGAYCNYNNTEDPDTIATYGRLYNWYATQDTRNIAPEGWRVANAVDWQILINYLGGDTIASKHLKEAGTLHWHGPNDGDNSSGFTALPGGRRYRTYPFSGFELYADFWTSSLYSETSAPFLYLTAWHDNLVYKGFNYKINGYSIRCIKE
ncbi:MAG: fibrobacter succinogenes major paralogous domain-containing protein [Bacteroidales bacterium]|nr:fibrobacter succinogenes major paralogous domain-containing protein [Bacteroidales bacterium]